MRGLIVGAIAALSFALLSGEAGAQTVAINPTLAKIIDSAKTEGKLLVRSTPASTLAGPEAQAAVQRGIKTMFAVDIPIEWSPGAAYGPLAAQLFQEMQAGTPASTDVLALTPAQVVPYLDKGLFRTIDWRAAMPSLPPALGEADGKAIRVNLSLPNILYNPKAAPWVADIKTAADLLKPEYKGKFVTTPFLGGFDTLLADDVWGVDKTTAYIKRIAPLRFFPGFRKVAAASIRIASGEISALVLDCGGGWPNNQLYRGKNLIATQDRHDISDCAAYITVPDACGASQHRDPLYPLSPRQQPEGQRKVMADYNGLDLGLYDCSYATKVVEGERAKGAKFVDVTVDWWKTHPHIDQEVINLIKLVQH